MPRWNPPIDHVGPKEHLGRRLFDEPMLVGAKDQRRFGGLMLRQFEETRSDEFSVDRLGPSSVEKSVVKFLRPLADAAGRTFHPAMTFNGWVVLKADQLEKSRKGLPLTVVASPDENNPYHAHIDTGRILESAEMRHYYIAMSLKELFATKGKVHAIGDQGKRQGLIRFVPLRIRKWLSERSSIEIVVC